MAPFGELSEGFMYAQMFEQGMIRTIAEAEFVDAGNALCEANGKRSARASPR